MNTANYSQLQYSGLVLNEYKDKHKIMIFSYTNKMYFPQKIGPVMNHIIFYSFLWGSQPPEKFDR